MLETLSWDEGHCVGYQEDFLSSSDAQDAYVCQLTIAAATLHWQAGAPGTYAAPAAGEHGKPPLAGMPVLEPEVVVETIATEAGQDILAKIAQGLARLLTSAPALTAALLLPINNRVDDGYKSEWDLSKLTQTPSEKDRARLDYLEAEQHRPLSEAEQDELASLLAVVRKVFVGGRNGPFSSIIAKY